MKKGAIYIDSDGFFWPSDIGSDYMMEERRLISFEDEKQSIYSMFEQYYLGFRSSIFICEDKFENTTEALEILRAYREGCISSAWTYVKNHMESKPALPVDFMWNIRMSIIDQLKDDYPEVENIHLRLSMKPRLSARTVDKNTIVFPALARTVINHCNLVIINSSFSIINESEHLSKEIDRRKVSRFVLPYLLFCHDDFSVKNLPIIGAYSEDAILTTIKFTNLQVMFIFAHEYAHILLRHFENNAINSKSNEELENDADSFALKVILEYIKKTESYSEHDVFTAIRWLFKYQLIEESIGVLIRGEKLDFFKSTYEKRRGKVQLDLINNKLKGSSLLDIVGFVAIVELQDVLYEFGLDLINEIINAFKKSDKTGGIEPWWEKITNK